MDGCLIMHKLCSTIGLFTLPRSRLYPIRSSETSRPPLGMWVSSQATSSSVLSLHVLLWPPKSLGSLTFLWLSIIWVPPPAPALHNTKTFLFTFRSMLYNGSEVIRDLEWVIFDEVHYINDAEVRRFPQPFPPKLQLTKIFRFNMICFSFFFFLTRTERSGLGRGADHAAWSRKHHSPQRHRAKRSGVQRVDRVSASRFTAATTLCMKSTSSWSNVNISTVELSRRIKKKHIYVISTLKRPVPLEHFLYTGNNTKTQKEMFLLLDATGNFLTKGYHFLSFYQ